MLGVPPQRVDYGKEISLRKVKYRNCPICSETGALDP